MLHIVPQHAQIHYRCALEIEGDRSMREIRSIMWDWLYYKVSDELDLAATKQLYNYTNQNRKTNTWFFKGYYNERHDKNKMIRGSKENEDKKGKIPWFQVRTSLLGPNDEPEVWGMELIHPDRDDKGVYWATTVTIEYNPAKEYLRFVCLIKTYLREFYIGPKPNPKEPSTPRFIKEILTRLPCSLAGLKVHNRLQVLNIHAADNVITNLYGELTDNSRQIPYVIISNVDRSDENVKNLIKKLQHYVLGNANVYLLSKGGYDELRYLGEDEPNLKNCLPNLQKSQCHVLCSIPSISDPFNRQYFEINEAIVFEIVRAFSRYSVGLPRDLVSIQSILVRRKISEHRYLAEKNKELREFEELFTSDNNELSASNQELKKKLEETREALSWYQEEFQKKEGEADELNYKLEEAKEQLKENRRAQQELREEQKHVSSIVGGYVQDLERQLSLCEELYSKRIFVCDEARDSARKYTKLRPPKDNFVKSWEMLIEAATTLYRCAFESDSTEFLKEQFALNRKSSGIDFTMNEGKLTNRNSALKADRMVEYKGSMVDVSPHLKFGVDKYSIRLHVYIDREDKKIVIGHFGEHKTTAGTQKSRR